MQYFLPIGILGFRSDWGLRNSQATCSLEQCEDEHDWIFYYAVFQMKHVSLLLCWCLIRHYKKRFF